MASTHCGLGLRTRPSPFMSSAFSVESTKSGQRCPQGGAERPGSNRQVGFQISCGGKGFPIEDDVIPRARPNVLCILHIINALPEVEVALKLPLLS